MLNANSVHFCTTYKKIKQMWTKTSEYQSNVWTHYYQIIVHKFMTKWMSEQLTIFIAGIFSTKKLIYSNFFFTNHVFEVSQSIKTFLTPIPAIILKISEEKLDLLSIGNMFLISLLPDCWELKELLSHMKWLNKG